MVFKLMPVRDNATVRCDSSERLQSMDIASSEQGCTNRHLLRRLFTRNTNIARETDKSGKEKRSKTRTEPLNSPSRIDILSQDDTTMSSSGSILRKKRKHTVSHSRTHPTDDHTPIRSLNHRSDSPNRSIRFADEEGQPMETIHLTDGLSTLRRCIVLLLHPEQKKFEFVHLYADTEDRNTMTDVLEHLRTIATHTMLQEQRYVGLCRLVKDGQELINSLAIQDYELKRDEIMVAMPKGYSAPTILRTSIPIISNRKVIRAMKRAKWSHHRPVITMERSKQRENTKRTLFHDVDDPSVISLSELEDAFNTNTEDKSEDFAKSALKDKALDKKTKIAIARLLSAGLYMAAGMAYLVSLRKRKQNVSKTYTRSSKSRSKASSN